VAALKGLPYQPLRRYARIAVAGFGFVMIAILVATGIWPALTTLNSGGNQVIPAACSGTSFGAQGAASACLKSVLSPNLSYKKIK
jgi:hypothetical protein